MHSVRLRSPSVRYFWKLSTERAPCYVGDSCSGTRDMALVPWRRWCTCLDRTPQPSVSYAAQKSGHRAPLADCVPILDVCTGPSMLRTRPSSASRARLSRVDWPSVPDNSIRAPGTRPLSQAQKPIRLSPLFCPDRGRAALSCAARAWPWAGQGGTELVPS